MWAYTCQLYVLQNFNIFSVLRMTGRLIPAVEFCTFYPLFWCNPWKWHCIAETCSSDTYHDCVLWLAINFIVLPPFTLQCIGWFQPAQDVELWRAPLTFWTRNYFFSFSTPFIQNANNTGTKYDRIMKQTAFWRGKNGEYTPCLKYSVPIFVE